VLSGSVSSTAELLELVERLQDVVIEGNAKVQANVNFSSVKYI
jgi:hypothetical protein